MPKMGFVSEPGNAVYRFFFSYFSYGYWFSC